MMSHFDGVDFRFSKTHLGKLGQLICFSKLSSVPNITDLPVQAFLSPIVP